MPLTSSLLGQTGRSRTAIWPVPDKIALDDTVVKVGGDSHWLFAAVDPETNVMLHFGLYTARITNSTKWFQQELQEKHDIENAGFCVDGAAWLHDGLFKLRIHFRHETYGDRKPVERVFRE